MKQLRTLVLGIAILLVSHRADALSLGLQAGLHIADSNVSGASSEKKFMFGGRLELPLVMNLHLQAEANFLDYGGAEYLSVPVFAKVKIEGDGVNPYLLVGPDFGFKVSGAGFKSLNMSLDFGAGVEFEVAPMTILFVDGRYALGLSNISAIGGDLKTRSIQVLAGLAFGI